MKINVASFQLEANDCNSRENEGIGLEIKTGVYHFRTVSLLVLSKGLSYRGGEGRKLGIPQLGKGMISHIDGRLRKNG